MPTETMLGIDSDDNLFVDSRLEKTIIGEMLTDSDVMRSALDELQTNDFSVHQYRRVFDVCVSLDNRG